jgi:hypothetical protein
LSLDRLELHFFETLLGQIDISHQIDMKTAINTLHRLERRNSHQQPRVSLHHINKIPLLTLILRYPIQLFRGDIRIPVDLLTGRIIRHIQTLCLLLFRTQLLKHFADLVVFFQLIVYLLTAH